ncbi:hypothetical protein BJX64DRAFT_253821 [Aspergillus heterothallicus]
MHLTATLTLTLAPISISISIRTPTATVPLTSLPSPRLFRRELTFQPHLLTPLTQFFRPGYYQFAFHFPPSAGDAGFVCALEVVFCRGCPSASWWAVHSLLS